MTAPSLYLLSYDGAIRPGKASTTQIADVLEGRDTDQLATVSFEDGAIVARALTTEQLDGLRTTLQLRRSTEFHAALELVLAAHRAIDGMSGVSSYSSYIVVDLEAVPWAEDVVREWAERSNLVVHDEAMPIEGKSWRRTAQVKATDRSWSPTLISMVWPKVMLDGASIVARDAEIDGRADDAAAIRAEAEMSF